jgi:hypothetical protein
MGFILFFLTLPVAFFIGLTLIGLPIAIFIFIIFFVEIYLSTIFVSFVFGDIINERLSLKSSNQYIIFATGLVAVYLVKMLPIINIFASMTIVLVAMGAFFQAKRQYFFPNRQQKNN